MALVTQFPRVPYGTDSRLLGHFNESGVSIFVRVPSDEQLAKLVTFLWEHDALCVINPEERRDGAQIIRSMGIFQG